MGTSKLVDAANQATMHDISSAANAPGTLTLNNMVFQLRVAEPSTLSPRDRTDIWNLWEANMRTLIEPSSFGWAPKKKKEELFHRASRFILVLHNTVSQGEENRQLLVAFSTFRFDYDEGEDLLYCYELQVADRFRKCGLGRFLVETLSQIGKCWKMEKIMLTVLKENTSAYQFYAKFGFVMDPISPDYQSSGQESDAGDDSDSIEEHEPCDYDILSKVL